MRSGGSPHVRVALRQVDERAALLLPLAPVAGESAPPVDEPLDGERGSTPLELLIRLELEHLHGECVEDANRLLALGLLGALALRERRTRGAHVVGADDRYRLPARSQSLYHLEEVAHELLRVALAVEELQADDVVTPYTHTALAHGSQLIGM